MPNYKEMYLTLFRAVEKATNILIDAQQQCEDMYVNESEPELRIVGFSDDTSDNKNQQHSD